MNNQVVNDQTTNGARADICTLIKFGLESGSIVLDQKVGIAHIVTKKPAKNQMDAMVDILTDFAPFKDSSGFVPITFHYTMSVHVAIFFILFKLLEVDVTDPMGYTPAAKEILADLKKEGIEHINSILGSEGTQPI